MRPTSHKPAARVATFTFAALLSLTALAVAALGAWLFPKRLPTVRDPRLVNVLFDSRPLVWALRLLLMFATVVLAVGGTYIVASAVARMRNGDWLRRAGPFEASEAVVANLEDEVHFWRSAARDFHDELDYLYERARETNDAPRGINPDDDYDKL